MCEALDLAGVEVCAAHEGDAFDPIALLGPNEKAERLRKWLDTDRTLPAIHARHGPPAKQFVTLGRPALFDDLGPVNILLWLQEGAVWEISPSMTQLS